MGNFGARWGDEIVKDTRRSVLFVRQQRAHNCVQVRSHNAFCSTQALQRFQPQDVRASTYLFLPEADHHELEVGRFNLDLRSLALDNATP